MALNADWVLPVGLGIMGTLIAMVYAVLKPKPIRIKTDRKKR